MSRSPLPDAPAGNWVDHAAPVSWRPFLRLMRADRPIGTWLLLLPCWWGTALAALGDNRSTFNIAHLALFAIGAFVMRGAGCVWNDITDREIDARVERTALRPLPSGAVSLKAAFVFMGFLLLCGLIILLQFNRAAIVTGIASLLVVAVYPFMKRITHFPQFVLGLAFNWGILVAWVAVHGALSLAPLLLYGAGMAWTLGYDTIYALQDIEDDEMIGVRSTARFFGPHVKLAIAAFYGVSILLVFAAITYVEAGPFSYCGVGAFAGLLMRQVWQLDAVDAGSALTQFRANRLAGLTLFAMMALDAMLNRSGLPDLIRNL